MRIQTIDHNTPNRGKVWSADGRVTPVAAVLAELECDPPANRKAGYRVVSTDDPALCLFHLLAGWLQSQVVVFAGRVETAKEMLEREDYVIAADIELRGRDSRLTYADLRFPLPATAPAAVVMSSGTTGKPKGILLSRDGIEHSADIIIDTFGLEPHEKYGNLSPVHTMGGLRSFMLALRFGRDIEFFDGAEERDLAFVQRVLCSGVSVALSGASFVRLLDVSGRWLAQTGTSLRAIMSCGSLYDDLASRRVRDAYGIEVANAYGQTETTGIVMCEPLGSYRLNRMAPPLAGVRQHFRELGEGVFELGIEYDHAFVGYLGQHRRNDPVVWTGDLVTRRVDGIEFKGRAGHAIKTMTGEGWLFPDRVEAWIRECTDLGDAAVRPLPDHSGLWCVVNARTVPDDLRQRIVSALGPAYASLRIYPGQVRRTPSGKLLDMVPAADLKGIPI